MKKRLFHGLLIGIACCAVALALGALSLLEWIENPTWDLRVRSLAKPSAESAQIRLIFLDQRSLDWGREVNNLSWPWLREIYASILSFCRRGGAKAVVFDVLYSEPSAHGVADDLAFAESIAQTPGFVVGAFFSAEQGLLQAMPPDLAVRTPAVEGLDAWMKSDAGQALAAPRASMPIPELATNATLVGNVSGSLSDDAVIRRTIPFRVFDGRLFPSLGLAAYLAAHTNAVVQLRTGELNVDGHRVPLDDEGQAILRYRGRTQTHRTVSVQSVFQSETRIQEGGQPVLDPAIFKDAYVFFGFTAPALFDLKASPVGKVYPGVEVHATFLDNLLAGDFIRPAPVAATALLALAMALLAGVVGRLCKTGWQTALAFALVPLPLAAGFAAYAGGFWLPVAPATVGAGLALVSAAVLNYALEGKQKRFIKGAFKQYLSPVIIDQLVKNPEFLRLGGERRELTIFFSDIKGFSTISESLTPEKLTALLNEYLTAMCQIIQEEGGTVNKYIGDAIVAFWNAPIELPDHPDRGVQAALRCQQKLVELRPPFKERFGKDLYVRIGLNTGPVVVGNMGSNQLFDYTFLGDAGNLASRLEGINKQFGTFITISEMTRSRLSARFAARELSRVRVVGRNEPVRIFEPMLREDFDSRRGVLEAFAGALQLYYDGKFGEAAQQFEALAEQDATAKIYAARCKRLAQEPPTTWDGVWEMKEK